VITSYSTLLFNPGSLYLVHTLIIVGTCQSNICLLILSSYSLLHWLLKFTSSFCDMVSFFIIPSPMKLRRDIVTLPFVLPSFLPSFRPSVRPSHPCEHSRINILQWILIKLGTYLVLKRIWNPIDFQGQRHRVKFLPHNILVNTLESTSFNGFWLNLVHT
jgi:hypothetical protein